MQRFVMINIILAALCVISMATTVSAAATPSSGERADMSVPANLQKILRAKQAMVNGLDRFPLTFWNSEPLSKFARYFDQAEVDSWAAAGFTIPEAPLYDANDPKQVGNIQKMLEWAAKKNMKLLIVADGVVARTDKPITPAYQEQRRKTIEAAKKLFVGKAGFWGFFGGDEPGVENMPSFQTWLNLLHEIAPDVPVYTNLLPYWPAADTITRAAGSDVSWPDYLDHVVKQWHLPILSFDCYAQTQGPKGVDLWFANLRLFREASWRNGVPFWAIPLCSGHLFYPPPNQDMICWQFNTAICGGASGIMWFHYYIGEPGANYRDAPVDRFWQKTDTYRWIQRVQVSFNRRYGELFNKLVSTKVMFYPNGRGGDYAFHPDELLTKITMKSPDPEAGLMIGEFVDAKGRRYVMFVNTSQTASVVATTTFRGPHVTLFSWDWNGHEHVGSAYSATNPTPAGQDVETSNMLAPGQEAVYRVSAPHLQSVAVIVHPVIDAPMVPGPVWLPSNFQNPD